MVEHSIASLLARIDALEEALRPFAECQFVSSRPPQSCVISTLRGAVYIEDFHRARRVLDAGER